MRHPSPPKRRRLPTVPPTPSPLLARPATRRGAGAWGWWEIGWRGRKEGVSQCCDLGGVLLVIGSQTGRKTNEQSAASSRIILSKLCEKLLFSISIFPPFLLLRGEELYWLSHATLLRCCCRLLLSSCKTLSFLPASPCVDCNLMVPR